MRASVLVLLAAVALLLAGTASAASNGYEQMSTAKLYKIADYEIKHGGVYSSRWGDASPRLIAVCYELVKRAFAPYGNSSWGVYIVRRESGCNPGAVNSSSGTTGIAQIHPRYHKWIDYYRLKHDLHYAVVVFVHMSRGGHSTRPWCLC